MRLFMFMVLHCNIVTVMYLFMLDIDVVIHQIATFLQPAPANQFLIYSNRCSTLYPLIKLVRLPGVT
jgi:hypothetical protein